MFNIFKIFRKRLGTTFTDEDRIKAAAIQRERYEQRREIQRMEYELEKMKLERARLQFQRDIDELKGDEDGLDLDSMLMQLLTPIIMKKINPTSPLSDTNQTNSIPSAVSYSEEQLAALWNTVPNSQKSFIKKQSDDKIKEFIISRVPSIDANTLEIALKLIRS